MYKPVIFLVFLTAFIFNSLFTFAQEEEPVLYYQMEPLNDSLFIQILEEVFIDPPDPKAEIIVDLRDPNNQIILIKGSLYLLLAFTPETRAKIQISVSILGSTQGKLYITDFFGESHFLATAAVNFP